MRPARLGRHPEDTERTILVRVLGVGTLCCFSFELGVLLLKGVRDVFEEDEAEHDVFVLGGIHTAT